MGILVNILVRILILISLAPDTVIIIKWVLGLIYLFYVYPNGRVLSYKPLAKLVCGALGL
jgi:hypothetical protein